MAWTRWEHSLTSTKTYDDPYGEITIKVSYRGPRQQEISGLGFWDGGNTFKFVPCSQRQGVGLGKPRAPIRTTPVSISKPAQWKSCLIRGSTRFIDTGEFRQPVQDQPDHQCDVTQNTGRTVLQLTNPHGETF